MPLRSLSRPLRVLITSIQLTVSTVYESSNCTGKAVQNNYVVATNGSCTKNSTCGALPSAPSYGYVTGCSMSDVEATKAYSDATLGSGVDSVTWFIYEDKSCAKFLVASDSQMTTSLETARCNPQTDGVSSKKFTHATDTHTITSSEFSTTNCTGMAANTSITMDNLGKCIPLGDYGLIAYATIKGTTHGLPKHDHSHHSAAAPAAFVVSPVMLLATTVAVVGPFLF